MTADTSVLIISHDVVDAEMAGPGIRYWELARVLGEHFRVTLAVPGGSSLSPSEGLRVWPYELGNWDSLAPVLEQASVVLLCGDVLAAFPRLVGWEIPLIVDGYDPHTLETLALFSGSVEQEVRHRERERILRSQCEAGDFFICASERQRDWWLGLLEAAGRINARTYEDDPSLRRLIDVVPFGLPSMPPAHTKQVLKGVWPGVEQEDKVLLWGGGLWQWLDPLTGIRAMERVCEQRNDVKLVFPGTRHPNAAVPEMPMVHRAEALAEELGLLDEYVFFGDWVAYDDWPNYLLEADVGLSLHFDTVETRLAFRSRVLDYLWAGLPTVATEGDATSELIADNGFGRIVHYDDEEAVAEAVLCLLSTPGRRLGQRLAQVRRRLNWERAARPLLSFCRDPRRAADKTVGRQPTAKAMGHDDGQLQAGEVKRESSTSAREHRPTRPTSFVRSLQRMRRLLPWT